MKRITSIFVAAILCVFSATVITSATAEPVNATLTIVSNDVEYTVEFINTTLSAEQQQAVADKLINGTDDTVQTYGLMCTLFGHNTEQNTTSVISHKLKTASPRCKKDNYLVTTCTRCDYYEQELTSSNYIVCCPED